MKKTFEILSFIINKKYLIKFLTQRCFCAAVDGNPATSLTTQKSRVCQANAHFLLNKQFYDCMFFTWPSVWAKLSHNESISSPIPPDIQNVFNVTFRHTKLRSDSTDNRGSGYEPWKCLALVSLTSSTPWPLFRFGNISVALSTLPRFIF